MSVPRPILTDMENIVCKQRFRFSLSEIREISGLLGLTDMVDIPDTRMKLEGWRALTVFLYKLAGTHSNIDVGLFFSYAPSTISRITRFVVY